MTYARLRRFLHWSGPLCALAALAAAGHAAEGCGSGGSPGVAGGVGGGSSTSTSTSTSTASSMSTSSASASSGAACATGTFAGTPAAVGTALLALDATPDVCGTTVYFTAVDTSKNLAPGVFKVPADGSAMTPVAVHAGNSAPGDFAAPFGIAIGTDGKTLYVSDPGATDATGKTDLAGVIFSLPTGGGAPMAITGTQGYETRSLDVVSKGGGDVVYFTGRDKATSGVPGVFSVPAAGGTVTTIKTGAPFVDPSGIAVASNGVIYVADVIANGGTGAKRANVIKIDTNNGNAATLFGPILRVGYPAGVALRHDEKTLLVSGLDDKGLDQVVVIDVGTMQPGTPIAMSINTLTDAAGLHRARSADVFALADSNAGVFSIK